MTCCSRKEERGVTNVVRQMSTAHQQSRALQPAPLARRRPAPLAATRRVAKPVHSTAPHKPSRWQPPADPATGRASAAQQQPCQWQAKPERSSNPVSGRRSRSGTLPTHSVRAQPGAQRHPAQLGTTRRVAANTCEHREHLSQG